MDPLQIESYIKASLERVKDLYDKSILFTKFRNACSFWLKVICITAGLVYADISMGGMAKLFMSEADIKATAHTAEELMYLDFYAGISFWISLMVAGSMFKTGSMMLVPIITSLSAKKDTRRNTEDLMFPIKGMFGITLFFMAGVLVYPLMAVLGITGTAITCVALLLDGTILLGRDNIKTLTKMRDEIAAKIDSFRLSGAILEEVKRTNTYTEYIEGTPITVNVDPDDVAGFAAGDEATAYIELTNTHGQARGVD